MSGPGLPHGRRFFCREWALDKLRRCLDARRAGPGSRTGVLVTGGPGAGKTALCAEVARPDSEAGRASGLASRCLAWHFCRREEPASGLAWRFVMALAEQLRVSPLLPPEYVAGLGRRPPPDPLSCQTDPQLAFQRFVRIAAAVESLSGFWRYRDLDRGQGSRAKALFFAPECRRQPNSVPNEGNWDHHSHRFLYFYEAPGTFPAVRPNNALGQNCHRIRRLRGHNHV